MKRIFQILLMPILMVAVSCNEQKSETSVILNGKWALVDEQQMTTEYASFASTTVETFKSSKSMLVSDGKVWNCKESDFNKISTDEYAVRGGIFYLAGQAQGKIVATETKMTIGDKNYLLITGFESESQTIVVAEKADCDYKQQRLSIPYKVTNPLPQKQIQVSKDAEWIKSITTNDTEIILEIEENNSGSNRSATLTIAYPGATPAQVKINQRKKSQYTDLSSAGSANSYIVSEAGTYSFLAVKGNSDQTVGNVVSAEVIWETFGTDTAPTTGDLIAEASYSDGTIVFKTNDTYKKGNALIAAKDASGKTLWSWHIWMTDKPEDQVYNNNAGTMMDRNLGATSSTAGAVESLGLIYQWGRKDPFLSASNISSSSEAKSSIGSWPKAVECNGQTGTIEYSIENPTTFINGNDTNADWQFAEIEGIDITLWASDKTIYDPCPPGYRVPDGGENGIWAKAMGQTSNTDAEYDSNNKGLNFGSSSSQPAKLTKDAICWYPNAGGRFFMSGEISNSGKDGYYWSVTDATNHGYSSAYDCCLYDGSVNPTNFHIRSWGEYVRCARE